MFIFFNISSAQLAPYEVNGYLKYLFSSVKYPALNERYDDHLIHARLNSRWYPVDNFKAVMEMRLRGFYGESVENTPGFTDGIKNNYDFLDLDVLLWEERRSLGYGEIDRLYIDWNYHSFQFTLGRQRIAWGTSWAWNPTDIFNPLSVLDFDYEERPAVDAFRAQYYTGPVSKIEIAFKPAREKENIIAAALYSFNIFDYDVNLISGINKERIFGGCGWVGDIYGAGFRGELLISEGKKIFSVLNKKIFGSENIQYSFVLSGDYTFLNSFYLHTEVLHNNVGAAELTAQYRQEAFSLGLLTAARWSVYQEFAYDIHPLVRGTVFGLFNPDDISYVIISSVSYSVITNLDLLVLMMFFEGDPFTEFGDYGSTAFIRIKFSF
jgi:hypothetical protein